MEKSDIYKYGFFTLIIIVILIIIYFAYRYFMVENFTVIPDEDETEVEGINIEEGIKKLNKESEKILLNAENMQKKSNDYERPGFKKKHSSEDDYQKKWDNMRNQHAGIRRDGIPDI